MVLKILSFSLLLTATASCSLVETTRQSLLGDSPRKAVKKEVKWVSKSQYDDLMIKYKDISSKYERLKEDRMSSKKAFNQLNELASTAADETVDVFGDEGLIPTKPVIKKPQIEITGSKINKELNYFKKAVALYDNSNTDEALKIFQSLEKSSLKQVRVRSRKYIADIYFSKSQFDLALQVYQRIITNDAYSGKVIPALRGAAICSGKLGLTEKKQQYESMLKDFFEVQI